MLNASVAIISNSMNLQFHGQGANSDDMISRTEPSMRGENGSRRVLVIANKGWEADPLVSVCLNPKLSPPGIFDWTPGDAGLFSTPITGARPDGVAPTPRCSCTTDDTCIEVWCIEDWMGAANHSNSKVKVEAVLPAIFAAGKGPDFVLAFGTASFPDSSTANGCVVVGSSAYLFNPYRDPPPGLTHNGKDDWDDPQRVGHLLTSTIGNSLVGTLSANPDLRLPIDVRLCPAPTNAAITPVLLPAASYVALSEINITNYDDYAWTDRLAFTSFCEANPTDPVGSIETTHGLIRIMSDAPFIFVSGITDRLGYFTQDLGPRTVAQNFLAAHNGGIAALWILPQILKQIATSKTRHQCV
jgi:hypothetical protein